MKQRSANGQLGFSLVELLVAMTVTLIITGAVYGLIAGGNNAFKKEPEMSERQQNIRMAMDLIMRDVANAGSGLPTFVQTFTRNLNACAGCPNGGAPMGPDGDRTDELELMTNSGGLDNERVCHLPGDSTSVNIRLVRGNVTVPVPMMVVLVTEDGSWTIREVTSTSNNNTGSGNCVAGQVHTQLNLNTGGQVSGLNQPSGVCTPNGWGTAPDPCSVTEISFASVVRYRIRNDVSGVPMLQRWSSDAAANFSGGAVAAGGFQTLARGIENLQVQYLLVGADPEVPANWVDNAPAIAAGNFASLIAQVRVTLGARSEATNVQGATTAASARDAIRGSLTSTGSPRSILHAATLQGPTPIWR